MKNAATIILPTLNEAGSIGPMIERIFAAKPAHHDYFVIVVDDGSTDGTEDRVKEMADRYPVSVIQRGRRMGLSSAVRDGAKAAATDWVLIIDADGSHPPEKIPELLEQHFHHGFDLVIGSRHVEGGKITGWPLKRELLSRYGTMLSSLLTNVYDPLSGFFSCRKEILIQHGEKAEGYKILLELLANIPASVKVKEVPIHFLDRLKGTSKMSLAVQVQFFSQLLRLFFHRLSLGSFRSLLIGLGLIVLTDPLAAGLYYWTGVRSVTAAHLFGFVILFALASGYLWSNLDRFKFFSHYRSHNMLFLWLVAVYSLAFRVALIEYCGRWCPNSPLASLGLAIVVGDGLFLGGLILGHLLSFATSDTANQEVKHFLQAFGLIGVIYLFKLVYLGLPDLIPQEALHWNRAMRLAPAYVDHPGGVALLIRLWTAILGTSEFAIRIGALLCGLGATLFVNGIGFHLSGRRSTGFISAAIFNLCPFFWGTSFFIFPDSPMIMFWAGSVYYLLRAIKGGGSRSWVLGGFCLGLAMWSKYTVVVLVFSMGLYFLASARGRILLLTRQPWKLGGVAILTLSPLLLHEFSRGWVTFKFQFVGRMAGHTWGFPSYLGSMMGEISPFLLVFVLLVAFIMAGQWRKLDDGQQWLLAASLPLLILYGIYSQWNRVKFSWPAPAFIALIPLVVAWAQDYPERYKRLKDVSFFTLMLFHLLSVVVFPLIFSLNLTFFPFKEVQQAATWRGVGPAIEALRRDEAASLGGTPFIIGLDKYFVAAEVSYYTPIPLDEVTSKNAVGRDGLTWNVWSALEKQRGRGAILLSQSTRELADPNLDGYFARISPVRIVPIRSGHQSRNLYYRVGVGYRPPLAQHLAAQPY